MSSQRGFKRGVSQESSSSQSQSQSGSQRKVPKNSSSQPPSDVPKNLLKKLINDCVYYLLVADQKKLIIKRGDIVKNVLKDNPKVIGNVLIEAENILRKVYGLNLVHLEGKGGYILVNNLEIQEDQIQVWSDLESAKHGLLAIVLTVIFMSENVIAEEVLWDTLNILGVHVEVAEHPLFGNVKKLLTTEFVRQMYLEYNVVQGSDPTTHEFRWGQRALVECRKRDLLELACKIFDNGSKPADWVSQLRLVEKEEEEMDQSQ